MSRIGNKIITIPEKVKVTVSGKAVNVQGPLGTMEYTLPEYITAKVDGNTLVVENNSSTKESNMMHGTTRARLYNLVTGVSSGYSKILELHGLGYRAQLKGKQLNLELGFSHPVLMDIPEGVKVEVASSQTLITISGADKIVIGDYAAKIKRLRKPEPYKGTGVRYQGEYVPRKAGKAAGKK